MSFGEPTGMLLGSRGHRSDHRSSSHVLKKRALPPKMYVLTPTAVAVCPERGCEEER